MIPCLSTSLVNRKDLLQRLIDSIDYPVGVLYVVNNSGRKVSLHDLRMSPYVNEFVEQVNDGNYGCAGGWNQAIDLAFNQRKYDYLLLFGNDIQCTPGDLNLISLAVQPETDFISANWAFSSWGLTRKGFGKLGWVDENYEMGYLEDGDYWRRVQLHGGIYQSSVGTSLIHGEAPHWGSSTINSDSSLKREVTEAHARNWEYHIRKWGGRREGNTEKFTKPFNDQSKPLWWWELSAARLRQPHFRSNG